MSLGRDWACTMLMIMGIITIVLFTPYHLYYPYVFCNFVPIIENTQTRSITYTDGPCCFHFVPLHTYSRDSSCEIQHSVFISWSSTVLTKELIRRRLRNTVNFEIAQVHLYPKRSYVYRKRLS